MELESLAGLQAAFEDWRRKKRHDREPVPAALLARAREAARVHGPAAVSRATKVDRARLKVGGRVSAKRQRNAPARPSGGLAFSRLKLAAPAPPVAPLAEIETMGGHKIRLFSPTDEVVDLLWSLVGSVRGGR